MNSISLQAIAKRVYSPTVSGCILDTHHCLACSPLPPLSMLNEVRSDIQPTKQASTLKGRGGGGGGLKVYFIVDCPFKVRCLQEIGKY